MITTSRCTFTSDRGHRLSARLDQPDSRRIRGTAVFAHCFTCSKDLHVERQIAQSLTTQGFAVLAFDFTGLGRSEGELADSTFSADVDDLVAAAAYLAEEIAPPTLLVGHSLGGAAVLAAAPRVDSVVAVATIGAPADPAHVEHLLADSLEEIHANGQAQVEIGGRSFTIGRSFVEDLQAHRLVDTLPGLGKAVLLLHSPRDEVVGVDNARILYDAAKHPKSFVSLDTADHLLSDQRDAHYAAEVIAAWAERYLPDPPEEEPVERGSYEPGGATATTGRDLVTTVTSRGHTMVVDEPASVGGTEAGPTPYDYLSAALASCTTLTLRIYADRMGYPLESATASVTHDRVHAKDCDECEAESGRVERFTKVLTIVGDELDEATRADLRRVADKCPVHKTLHGQIEVHTRLG